MASILVVDDRAINREFLSSLLTACGHEVTEAADGSEALVACLLQHPDLIITDLMMPVMDGVELTQRLRGDPATRAIPVIFYTATYRVHEVRELARACGVEIVLPKPSEPRAILDAICRALKIESASQTISADTPETADARGHAVALQQMLRVRGGTADDGVHALNLRLAALLEIAFALATERDSQHMLSIFCRGAQEIMGTELAGVIVVSGSRAIKREATATGLSSAQVSDLAGVDLDRGFLAKAALGVDAVQIDLTDWPGESGLPASHPPARRLLAVPLLPTEGIHGVAYFADKRNHVAFDDEDGQFALTLAAQLSLAYGNLKLLEEVQQHAGQLRLEVDKRNRIAKALSESEIRFRQVLDNLQEAVFLIEPAAQTMLYVSPGYASIWGRGRETLYADPESWRYPIHPRDRELVDARWEQSRATGTLHCEFRIIRADGSLRWVRLRGVPVAIDARLHRIVAIAEDITKDHRAAEVLRESEMRFRQLAENILSVFFLVDLATNRTLYVSPSYEAIWGRSCASLYADPRSWMEVVHPDDLDRVVASDGDHERLSGFDHEYRIIQPSGAIRWIWVRGFPIRNEAGRVHRLAAIAEDITVRRAAQDAIAASEARYRQLFDRNPLPMWVYDCETLAFMAVNTAAIEHYGYSREEFLAMSILDIRPDRDIDAVRRQVHSDVEGIKHSGVCAHKRRDGSLIDVEITSHQIDFSGRRSRLVLAHDVSERNRQQLRIQRLTRIREVIGGISSAMLRMHDRIALLDEACRVAATAGVFPFCWVSVPDPSAQNVGILASHSQTPGAIEVIRAALAEMPPDDAPSVRAARSGRPLVMNDLAQEPTLAPIRARLLAQGYRSGAAFPLRVGDEVSAVLVLLAAETDVFDDEEINLLSWLAADLSYALEGIDKSARLDHLAYYDALTGLANARLFHDRLSQLVLAAHGNKERIAMVALDLEGFTHINDTFGRAIGDQLLCRVAERLGEVLAEPYALSRIGADTFVAASPRDPETISTRLRETLLDALQAPFACEGHQIKVDAQAGVAIYPDDAGDASELFRNAESALMLAKSSGERYAYYSSDMNARIAARRQLHDELRQAIDSGGFVLHYQSRIDMISGELIGAEALIRWNHPQRGLLVPAEFISQAEETGLIVQIGAWVIRTVCEQQACWLKNGVRCVPIAVNLSSVQFEKGNLLATVRSALQSHPLDAHWLDVELTESAVMKDPEAAASTLLALRKLGVGVALDDFGTGFSSLAHLKRFPFDSVKIDRSFVTDITSNPEDAAIATAIIAMAHTLKLKVVAEGVETEGQFNFLRARSCDEMQGHFFGAAVPAEDFEALLTTHRRMQLPATRTEGQPALLLVDDETAIRSALIRMLRADGYRILSAASGQEGLDLLAVNQIQVIIADQRMPGMSGTEFLSRVKELHPDTVRMILSGYTDLAVVTDAVNRGSVYKFLTKPWNDDELRAQVRDAFRRYRADKATP